LPVHNPENAVVFPCKQTLTHYRCLPKQHPSLVGKPLPDFKSIISDFAPEQAKAVLCRANLKEWGLVWMIYIEENNGKFPEFLSYNWMQRLVDYYSNTEKLLYCPMTGPNG